MLKITGILVGLIILVAVGGGIYLSTMDFNQYKGLVAEQAKAATGRDLKIEGDLNLEVSLTPRLAVEGVSFSNASWGSRPQMVTVKKFAAEISLMPLLSGNIKVNQIILEGVDLLAEKDKSGKVNWELGAAPKKADAPAAKGGPAALPVVNNISIKDVKITYKDAQAGQDYTLGLDAVTFKADGVDAPLQLSVEGSVNGQKMSLKGNVGSISALAGGKVFPLKLDIAALGVGIGLDGKAGVPGGKPTADIKLALNGASLENTLKAAASLAPALKDVVLPIKGSFKVAGGVKLNGPQKIAIEGLDLVIGPIAAQGRLSADLTGKRPAVDVALKTDTLNLDELLPKDDKKAAPAPAPATAPAKKSDGRVFPNDPLPLEGLKAADAKVLFDANKVIIQGTEITGIKVALNLKNGRLHVKPLAATVADGTIVGDVLLNASKSVPTLKSVLTIKQLDFGKVLNQRGLTDIAHGKVDVNVDVSGSGTSVRKIMAGLGGKVRVVTKDGKLENGALNIISADLTNVFKSKDDKKIVCGVVHLNIKKGLANVHSMVFETGGISVVGTGSAKLSNETLKMRVDPRSKKANIATVAMIPVNISGTFAKPEWALDVGATAGNVAAGVARTAGAVSTFGLSLLLEKAAKETVMKSDPTDYCGPALAGKKVVPGKVKSASAPKPSSPAPTQKKSSNPIESIGSGLKGLFGK